MGLSRQDMNRLLIHCHALVPATRELLAKKLSSLQPSLQPTPSSSSTQGRESLSSALPSNTNLPQGQSFHPHGQHRQRSTIERKIISIEKDWIRFITCCRICLWNFYE